MFEWFWRGAALAETKRVIPAPNERASALAERANSAAEVAFGALSPGEPSAFPVEAISCELYRQSAYWALCALSPKLDTPATEYEASVWDALDEQALERAAVPAARREWLLRTLRAGSFVYFAEQPAAELVLVCPELRTFAESLLAQLRNRVRALEAIYLQRAWRLCLLLVLVVPVIAAALALRGMADARRDLAAGKPWRTSSQYAPLPGCTSPAQECPESPDYFFCTSDDASPWIEFDLGAPREFSALWVENRLSLPERASPIVVEVSDNRKQWRIVAARDTTFNTWRASFAPVKSRWVRLRVKKSTWFHLVRVRIIP